MKAAPESTGPTDRPRRRRAPRDPEGGESGPRAGSASNSDDELWAHQFSISLTKALTRGEFIELLQKRFKSGTHSKSSNPPPPSPAERFDALHDCLKSRIHLAWLKGSFIGHAGRLHADWGTNSKIARSPCHKNRCCWATRHAGHAAV